MTAERYGTGAGRKRLSKRVLRWWAYVGGAASFAVPWFVLNAVPRPPASGDTVQTPPRVIEVHRVLRRIIVEDPPNAPTRSGAQPVRYVYVGGSGGGASGGGGGVHTGCSTC